MASKGKRTGKLSAREFDARERRIIRIIDGTFSLLRTTVRGAVFLGGAYIIGSVLAPFAGQKTELSAVISALVDLKADRYFFLITALLASGGWWQERRKRRKLIESWGPYVRSLEEKIDPNRSSSGLLISGQPRKEDADAL
jgi:hypothetical protein